MILMPVVVSKNIYSVIHHIYVTQRAFYRQIPEGWWHSSDCCQGNGWS